MKIALIRIYADNNTVVLKLLFSSKEEQASLRGRLISSLDLDLGTPKQENGDYCSSSVANVSIENLDKFISEAESVSSTNLGVFCDSIVVCSLDENKNPEEGAYIYKSDKFKYLSEHGEQAVRRLLEVTNKYFKYSEV